MGVLTDLKHTRSHTHGLEKRKLTSAAMSLTYLSSHQSPSKSRRPFPKPGSSECITHQSTHASTGTCAHTHKHTSLGKKKTKRAGEGEGTVCVGGGVGSPHSNTSHNKGPHCCVTLCQHCRGVIILWKLLSW